MPDMHSQNIARFEPFELDLAAGELQRNGRKVRLPEQQFQILQMLLLRRGQMVSREEIRKRLWPNDTVVEFDRSINAAIMKLRSALGDSADEPRFIETVARRGYRFLAPVQLAEAIPAEPPAKKTGDDSLVGQKVSHYLVLALLGGGGMGLVYKAEDLKLDRPVALKFLPEELATDSVTLQRFEREARTASSLNHPNICTIYGVEEHGTQPFIVMELLEGKTLRELISGYRGTAGGVGSHLPLEQLLEIGIQIAHGLGAAHQKGIIHRDIKPANIFVTIRGEVKILDFGLAKIARAETDIPFDAAGENRNISSPTAVARAFSIEQSLSRTGFAMGTAGYMSPEQVRGEKLDSRTDLFSFGLILFEMATGQRAFSGDTAAIVHDAILHRTLPPVRALNPDLPAKLEEIIRKALEKDREQRFQSASDLAFALETLSGVKARVAVPSGRSEWPLKWIAIPGFAVVIALLIALLVWWRFPSAVPVVESVVQLTDDGRAKHQPLSDGSRIYFTEGDWGGQKIAQVSVTGGPVTPLETGFADAEVDEVARDGSGLLVRVPNRFGLDEGPSWWVPLPAGEPHRLGSFDTVGADLLPDRRIVFAKSTLGAGDRTQWFIADKDGSNPRELVSFPGFAGDTWASPDGRRVLFSQQLNGDEVLFDIGVDGKGLREIRKINDGESNFIWTPDENYLVYQAQNFQQLDKRSDIWLLPMRTGLFRRPGKPIRLTNGPIPYSNPYPSPNGTQIFVLGTKQRGELVRYDMQSNEFKPFLSGISATHVTFSRNGEWVAYVSYPDQTLWRSRSDGTERSQLTFSPARAYCPSISPDGTKVAFGTGEAFGTGGFRSSVISMESGQKIDGPASSCAAWSPDGNYLYYYQGIPIGAGGVIVDVRTGKKSAVPSSEDMAGFWLTQNTLLCYNTKRDKFRTFDLKTQKWTDFALRTVRDAMALAILSPDRKYLYFVTAGADPKAFRIRLSDRRVETITSLKDLHSVAMSIAPDGSPIFTRDIGYQEIYALNIRWP